MIFTTSDASANSVAAIAQVTLTRLSLGRSSSIDNFCGVKPTRRNRNDRSIFHHAFRCSKDGHLDLRIAFGSRDKGCQGHPYLARLRTWLGVVAIARDRSGYVVGVKVHDSPQIHSRFKKAYRDPQGALWVLVRHHKGFDVDSCSTYLAFRSWCARGTGDCDMSHIP